MCNTENSTEYRRTIRAHVRFSRLSKIRRGLILVYVRVMVRVYLNYYGLKIQFLFVVVIKFYMHICIVQCGHFCPKPQKLLYHNSPSTTLIIPIPYSRLPKRRAPRIPRTQEMLFRSDPTPKIVPLLSPS